MKAMTLIGAGMFLAGICCGSIVWAAALVVGGGAMAAIGGMYMEEEGSYCDRF